MLELKITGDARSIANSAWVSTIDESKADQKSYDEFSIYQVDKDILLITFLCQIHEDYEDLQVCHYTYGDLDACQPNRY